MNELEILKKLSQLSDSNSLPKDLLRKHDLRHSEIEDVVLSFCNDCGELEVGFVVDNGYDASNIMYVPFNEVVDFIKKEGE